MAGDSRVQARQRQRLPNPSGGDGSSVPPRRGFVPAYVKTYELGQLTERMEAGRELLHSCKVCPRDCQVNRWENKTGVCKTGPWARVSSAFAHFGEEDCLRGCNGSGTIFFGGCNLGCVFCQNLTIQVVPVNSRRACGFRRQKPSEKYFHFLLDSS